MVGIFIFNEIFSLSRNDAIDYEVVKYYMRSIICELCVFCNYECKVMHGVYAKEYYNSIIC